MVVYCGQKTALSLASYFALLDLFESTCEEKTALVDYAC